jgi:hypothetical protein
LPHVLGARWPLKPEALARRTTKFGYESQQRFALYVLGDTRHAEQVAQPNYCSQQALSIRALLSCCYERTVELYLVEPQLAKISD